MARASLRRYDVQAVYALVLALAAAVPLLGAIFLFFRNYDAELRLLVYGKEGMFLYAYLGAVGMAGLLGAIAFFLGWSSAGQRRNERQTWSWAGFFVGGTVATLAVIMLLALAMLRLKQGGG